MTPPEELSPDCKRHEDAIARLIRDQQDNALARQAMVDDLQDVRKDISEMRSLIQDIRGGQGKMERFLLGSLSEGVTDGLSGQMLMLNTRLAAVEKSTAGIETISSTMVTLGNKVAGLERENEEAAKSWAAWKQAFLGLMIAIGSPAILWFVQVNVQEHVHPIHPVVAASPHPSAAPILAASPGPPVVAVSPATPLPRLTIDGAAPLVPVEPPPNPQPEPMAAKPHTASTPWRPGGPAPNTRPHVATCKKTAPKAAPKTHPKPKPTATPHH